LSNNIRICLVGSLFVGLLAACGDEPTRPSKPAVPRAAAPPKVEMPVCEGSGASRALSTAPDGELPRCESLNGSGDQTPTMHVEKLAVVYDALPLKGRSWLSFAGYPAAWGRPSVQWVPAEEKVGGLDTRASFCRPIQSFDAATDPGWKADSCDRPAGAGAAKDTRADAALAGICRTLTDAAPPFDAAVLVFDHIIDSPATGEDAASKFAEAVVSCGQRGLVMRLVAQPGAHRYAYVIGRPGTAAALHAISARLTELLGASSAHANSPNAIFRSDRKVCPTAACPAAYDVAISNHFEVVRGSKVTANRKQPSWGKPDPNLRPNVREAKRKLPPPLRPDAFSTQCGSDIAVTANSTRPMSDAAGLGAVELSWGTPLGEKTSQADYPYLEEHLLAAVSVAKTARTSAADLKLVPEETWSSRLSASSAAAGATSVTEGMQPAASSACTAPMGASLTPILRVESTSAELIYWRSRAGDGTSASKLNTAFPMSLRQENFDPAQPVDAADRFGWLTTTAVGRDVAQFNLELQSSPLSLDCVTATMVQTLSSVVSFEKEDFNAWLCTAERKQQCPSLAPICDNAQAQPGMGGFFRDLMAAPAVRFGGSNRHAPDNARAASLSVARVFAAVSEELKKSMPGTSACSNSRVSLGCAVPPPKVRSGTKPENGSGSGEPSPTGSGSGSGILHPKGVE